MVLLVFRGKNGLFAAMNARGDSPLPLSDERCMVRSGALSMTIDPALAGRVTCLCYGEENLLTTPAENPRNWGATYWTSPQADWGWPPVPEVDHLPFSLHREGDAVVVVGPKARIGEREFFIEKRFCPAETGVIDTLYTIVNAGSCSFKMANWEISRVHRGGLTFFPTGEQESTPIFPHAALEVKKEFGTTFYDHTTFSGARSLKLHADGRGGYLAHLSGRLLLLKLFNDSTPSDQAPGEGECEIFANEDGKYVEIEVQGRYQQIPPEGRSVTRVKTTVCELPSGLERGDRRGLRQFADAQAARFA